MAWEIEGSDEFQKWFRSLRDAERISVARKVDLLEQVGPSLGRPDADRLKGSRYPNMKELIVQHAGDAYRIPFAFDPRRVGILLLGVMLPLTQVVTTAAANAAQLDDAGAGVIHAPAR